MYFELQRESEIKELIVGNGILCDRNNPAIKHPLLTKKVQLEFDPASNTIYIKDLDFQAELYSDLFQSLTDINLESINNLRQDLERKNYHPLDRNETPEFLEVLIRQLNSDSLLVKGLPPNDWKLRTRLLVYCEPIFIVRNRLDGTLKAIEQIIDDIETTGVVPDPICDIVSGGKDELSDDIRQESIEEQLAAVGGESIDILLSKAANREQLEIAKRLELYNAVLVQGPPGTGKTHTIANLMGHFLAKGKSILVTSHTPKALNVLKNKLPLQLQSLCVSLVEFSDVDMERSIDGITDYMSHSTAAELKRDKDRIAKEREQIIDDLSNVRKKIFRIKNQECNSIVYNGEEYSPISAAKFVKEHQEDLSYIPGNIKEQSVLALSLDELDKLYRSNQEISSDDEQELLREIPDPKELMPPSAFEELITELKKNQKKTRRNKYQTKRQPLVIFLR